MSSTGSPRWSSTKTGIPSPLSPWLLPKARSVESSSTPTRPAFGISAAATPNDEAREWGDEKAVTRKGAVRSIL